MNRTEPPSTPQNIVAIASSFLHSKDDIL